MPSDKTNGRPWDGEDAPLFSEVESRKDLSVREKELFMLLMGYTSCVSLVVEHFDAEEPGTVATKNRLKSLLTFFVDQWIQKNPDVRQSVRRKLQQIHQQVLETSESDHS